MSDRTLKRLVILDGTVWPAGSTPPASVAEKITNPNCWEGDATAPATPGPSLSPTIPAEQPAGTLDDLVPVQRTADGGIPGSGEGGPVPPAPDAEQPQPDVVTEEPAEPVTPVPDVDDADQPELPEPPPRSGRGSGETAWRAWAAQAGVDVSDADGRDEIIDACERAGVL